MRHVLTLVDGRVVALAVVLLVLAAVTALVVDRRNGAGWRTFFALCGTALIATLTLGNRGIVVSDNGLADDLTWWTRNWGTLPSLVSGDIGWWSGAFRRWFVELRVRQQSIVDGCGINRSSSWVAMSSPRSTST